MGKCVCFVCKQVYIKFRNDNEFLCLDFSKLLIAACEKKSIVLFDPITNRQTKAVKNAHQDSVNCVKYV